MLTFSQFDHNRLLRAAGHSKATPAERDLLSYCASMCAAGEPVSDEDYRKAAALAISDFNDSNVFNRG